MRAKKAMQANIDFAKAQLEHGVCLVRLELTKLQRVLMGVLIVLDVHGITVLDNLREASCRSVNDLDWSKQLRYYCWECLMPGCSWRTGYCR
jgi:hypothetical protein